MIVVYPRAIPRSVVPEDYFPRYCAGAGYILSQAALPSLIVTWPSTPLIHIEDAWLTGLVAAKANVPQQTIDYLPSWLVYMLNEQLSLYVHG